MASCEVTFMPSVEKDLRRLPHETVARIISRIEKLGDNPIGEGAIKLSGSEGLYRIRVGQYRVIYLFDSDSRRVIIHHVRHRRDVYRSS